MRQIISIMLLSLMLGLSVGQAAYLQYDDVSLQVTGVSDAPILPFPGRPVIHLEGTLAADIAWPDPLGCPVGTGEAEYTDLSNPAAVTAQGGGMVVRATLGFFSSSSPLLTGCRLVQNAADLDALLSDIVDASFALFPLMPKANTIWTAISAKCPAAVVTAECNTARANRTIITNAAQPSEAQLAEFSTNVIDLYGDANVFKAGRGW